MLRFCGTLSIALSLSLASTIRDFPVPSLFDLSSQGRCCGKRARSFSFLQCSSKHRGKDLRNQSFRALFLRAFILYLIRSKLELAKMPVSNLFYVRFVSFERQISFSTAHAALTNEGQPALEGLRARGWNLRPYFKKSSFPPCGRGQLGLVRAERRRHGLTRTYV